MREHIVNSFWLGIVGSVARFFVFSAKFSRRVGYNRRKFCTRRKVSPQILSRLEVIF